MLSFHADATSGHGVLRWAAGEARLCRRVNARMAVAQQLQLARVAMPVTIASPRTFVVTACAVWQNAPVVLLDGVAERRHLLLVQRQRADGLLRHVRCEKHMTAQSGVSFCRGEFLRRVHPGLT